jgi:uncharacterized membrane protein
VVIVTYDQFISDAVKIVEAVGAAIMILGGLWALLAYGYSLVRPIDRAGAYPKLRQSLGRAILLGLEVLIVGDIVRTIIVEPTVKSVAVLGLIVVIRIVLSFSLEVEIDGVWPWNRWRLAATRTLTPAQEASASHPTEEDGR